MKDWTGNYKSIYTTLGASNHSTSEREEHDYYATESRAIDALLEKATIDQNIWECACGEGHLSKRLLELGYNVKSTDLIYRGFGEGGVDFLSVCADWQGDILTNPPYKYAQEFVEKALEIVPEGKKIFMFLKLTFLEGKARRVLFNQKQLKTVYVSSGRLKCAKNGKFEETGSSAAAYAWFEFEKGYKGDPKIMWIN